MSDNFPPSEQEIPTPDLLSDLRIVTDELGPWARSKVYEAIAELSRLRSDLRNAQSRVAQCEKDMVEGWKVQEELKHDISRHVEIASKEAAARVEAERERDEAQNDLEVWKLYERDQRDRAERAGQSLLELERQRDNLAMFAKMLVLKVRKHEPDATIAKRALAYLCSKGLQGSPLREDALDAARTGLNAAPSESDRKPVGNQPDCERTSLRSLDTPSGAAPDKWLKCPLKYCVGGCAYPYDCAAPEEGGKDA